MPGFVDRFKEAYMKEYERNPICTLFITIMVAFIIVFVVIALFSMGQSLWAMFWQDKEIDDTFMDYFNSVMYSADNPYSYWQVIYPPFITVVYAIIGQFTIPYVKVGVDEDIAHALRDSQAGLMSYFLITLLAIYVMHMIISRLTKDKNVRIRFELFFLVLMFSYPFLYAIERGNSIILTVTFCFLFLMGYKSENKIVRYLAYLSLGCAAGIKIYPALLGLLILRDRDYKETLICMLIGAAVMFLPFLFTDGNIGMLLDAISTHTVSKSAMGSVNLGQMITYGLHFIMELSTAKLIGDIVGMVFLALCVIVVLFDRKMKYWKAVTLLTCGLILGPGVGTSYVYCYLILAIVYFMISENEMTKENKIFVICFALTISLYFCVPFMGSWGYPDQIRSFFVIIISVLLLREGFLRIRADRNRDVAMKTSDLSIKNDSI